jgi:hypothetical protein
LWVAKGTGHDPSASRCSGSLVIEQRRFVKFGGKDLYELAGVVVWAGLVGRWNQKSIWLSYYFLHSLDAGGKIATRYSCTAFVSSNVLNSAALERSPVTT